MFVILLKFLTDNRIIQEMVTFDEHEDENGFFAPNLYREDAPVHEE